MTDARIVSVFPHRVLTEDPVWIGLSDGARLAATVWRPETDAPVPAVVEMIPYRRRDGTVFRDMEIHPYLAGHGVASVRIDIRGSGDSDGDLDDEYLPLEQRDACEAIAWIAAQPWCNGRVGMTGISWGGFNSLQVAALRPPALKAIITLCSTDDRYADDIHYMGGALLTEQEMWSTFMLAKKALPPDPQIVGERWRAMWARRLETDRSLSEVWLAHQRRDDYWRQGSVCEDFGAIEAATLAVCGWEDSYSNSVPRLLAGLRCPKAAIMGPWTHSYPNRGSPGPLIGYLQEALRWWRHWLADEPTGIMDEPMFRVWIGESERPRPWYPTHAGRWAAEAAWPSHRIEGRRLFLNAGALGESPAGGAALSVRSPATAGTDCGRWGGYGGESPDMAVDQRREDALALCFDTPPLHADLTILGAVELYLEVVVDRPRAHLAARFCELWEDGTSALVTYGVLNLCHREGHAAPSACPVGEPFRARLRLNDVGRTFPKGRRLRLALATQHWPVLWPQPELVTLSLAPGRSTITLPVRPDDPRDAAVRFALAEISPPVPVTELAPGWSRRTVTDDVGAGVRMIDLHAEHGRRRMEDRGITVGGWNRDLFSIRPDDPLSAQLVSEYAWSVASGEADVETYARTELTATAEEFLLSWRIEAREGGALVHSRAETRRLPRDFL